MGKTSRSVSILGSEGVGVKIDIDIFKTKLLLGTLYLLVCQVTVTIGDSGILSLSLIHLCYKDTYMRHSRTCGIGAFNI